MDEVLIAQPAATFPGTNAKQFYVSVSRAKESVRIYTDDKEQLLAHAERSGDRTSALEVAALKKHEAHIQDRLREAYPSPELSREPTTEPVNPFENYEPDYDAYEPGL